MKPLIRAVDLSARPLAPLLLIVSGVAGLIWNTITSKLKKTS
jgi:hypothetical protein